jgi:hypothetical protein
VYAHYKYNTVIGRPDGTFKFQRKPFLTGHPCRKLLSRHYIEYPPYDAD